MFNHIVLFKLKEFDSDDAKAVAREQVAAALLGLPEKITQLKSLEVGTHFELNGGTFDISLITRFDSREDFEIYRDHPEHLKVVTLVRANTVDRAVVDYFD